MAMLAAPAESHGTDRMYPRTPAGVIEIKTVPESFILVTESDGSYFDRSNNLFGKLFNYIKEHDIPMTAPVEGSIDEEARMVFYVGPQVDSSQLFDEGDVRVLRLPEREVAVIGARGSYKEKNVRRNLEKLKAHLAGQTEYEIDGPPYSVFWNPPFVPWFLRHLEIHIPVRRTEDR